MPTNGEQEKEVAANGYNPKRKKEMTREKNDEREKEEQRRSAVVCGWQPKRQVGRQNNAQHHTNRTIDADIFWEGSLEKIGLTKVRRMHS